MLAKTVIGRSAGALKYDVLTALTTYALAGDKHRQRSVLRLQSLITARYNWGRNELSIGRREIASLWGVEERTVKREMSRFRVSGWMAVKHPAVRGRVAVYELDLTRLLSDTRDCWARVGPDFVLRMEALLDPAPQSSAAPDSNVVPFQAPTGDGGVWSRVAALLHQGDAQRYTAWFQHLTQDHVDDGILVLRAPTRFLAQYVESHFGSELQRLCHGVAPEIIGVRIVSPS